MTASTPRKRTRRAKLAHSLQLHVKLIAAVVLGVAVYIILTQLGGPARTVTRALIAWNVGVLVYLVLAAWAIARSELDHLCERAEEEDEGAALVLVLTVVAAATSMVAIFAELGGARGDKNDWLSPVLSLSTAILSWVFIQAIFAFHYAHDYYGAVEGGPKGGLKFPGDKSPEYLDFVYFSFVIGMTFQVSDVQVTSKAVRRLVVTHGVVSFFYNLAVLSLMVNMGGEFIKG
jgi:uncharacterized membrane protein